MSSHTAVFQALVELQISLFSSPGPPINEDPPAITREAFEYLETLPDGIKGLFRTALDRMDGESREKFKKGFAEVSLDNRTVVLDDLWGDHLWHDLISQVVRLGWLVIYSRDAARKRVGFTPASAPVVDIPEPAAPPLTIAYDICIVGTGAGASVVATRAAEKGKRVLMVEDGRWISPKDYPTRDDRALREVYRDSGVQPALPKLDHILRPGGFTFINVLQPRVVGGGPAINNAIHLPISRDRVKEWGDRYECPVTWAAMEPQLLRVGKDLGVNTAATGQAGGERAAKFRAAAQGLGWGPGSLPVSIERCVGCGSCNAGCRFGLKTGGLHGPRPQGAPRGYLDRALASGAVIASRIEARSFDGGFLGIGGKVRGLNARDLRTNKDVKIRAGRYVLSAGPLASSHIIRRSRFQLTSPVGRHIAANVVLPVFALMPGDFPAGPFDPGLQMCVYVDKNGSLLETWFHYPGSLAPAVPEWLRKHADIMLRYRRLAACGVVVPTDRQGEIGPTGTLALSLSDVELTRMVRGIVSVADVFIAAGADTVIPATARPLYVRKDHYADDVRLLRQSIRGPADLTLATAHPQGGNAIGRRKSGSVVSEAFSLFDFKNLFVADASLFPAGCGVNPQMTAMALAHLAADRVLE